jgi:post-segregation antitoxin (ccd killing protein)
MPRMQVYLPENLYREVKKRGLPASELLQAAIRGEVKRRDILAETDRYLAELVAKVGEPTAKELAKAEAMARRIKQHQSKHAR